MRGTADIAVYLIKIQDSSKLRVSRRQGNRRKYSAGFSGETGRGGIGRGGMEIHFLNGGWDTVYLTDGN